MSIEFASCELRLRARTRQRRQTVRKPGVTVSVCKRFEFVIMSVNNLKTARHKIVDQSENGYARDDYTDW